MSLSGIVGWLGGAVFLYFYYRQRKLKLKDQDLNAIRMTIEVISLTPPSGSTVCVGDRIQVEMYYHCEAPIKQEFSAWAYSDELASTYMPTFDEVRVGEGRFRRWFSPSEVGEITRFTLSAQTAIHAQRVYEREVAVHYQVVENAQVAQFKGDGFDSRVMDVSVSPSGERVLKVGTTLTITVDYDISSRHGLYISVQHGKLDGGSGRHDTMGSLLNGRGKTKRSIMVSSASHLRSIVVTMTNQAHELVWAEEYEVDYSFVD